MYVQRYDYSMIPKALQRWNMATEPGWRHGSETILQAACDRSHRYQSNICHKHLKLRTSFHLPMLLLVTHLCLFPFASNPIHPHLRHVYSEIFLTSFKENPMSEGSLHLHKVSSTHLETPTVHGIFSVQHSPSLHVPFLRTLASKAQHVICSARLLIPKGSFSKFPLPLVLRYRILGFATTIPLSNPRT